MYTIDFINLLYMLYRKLNYKRMIKCEDTVFLVQTSLSYPIESDPVNFEVMLNKFLKDHFSQLSNDQ